MKRKELTFNQLKFASLQRLPIFKNKKGEIAHPTGGINDWSRSDWLEAAVGELGEYSNFSKKYRRGDIGAEEFLENAKKELADTVIYIDLLSSSLGIDLGNAIREKFNEQSRKIDCDILL